MLPPNPLVTPSGIWRSHQRYRDGYAPASPNASTPSLTWPLSDPAEKERKDANKKHCEAFFTKSGERFKTYFARWAEKQVNLSSLVVHPDFRLRGGGTMLMKWGMTRATAKGWPVTLCASPMGRLLYEYLGFEKIASEVVQVEGEEEILTSTVMIYNIEV
ncbi:hypothetical protein F5884DRAFT_104897 [Xylogone sp. PMI_703]|nr:hypothetical protein F5884DRAFT_104897 [Xylogone sp. PMI_703]